MPATNAMPASVSAALPQSVAVASTAESFPGPGYLARSSCTRRRGTL